jgi:hypothetical protein
MGEGSWSGVRIRVLAEISLSAGAGTKGGGTRSKKNFFFSKNEFFFAQKSDRPNYLLKAAKNRFVSGHIPKTVFLPADWL